MSLMCDISFPFYDFKGVVIPKHGETNDNSSVPVGKHHTRHDAIRSSASVFRRQQGSGVKFLKSIAIYAIDEFFPTFITID